MKPVFANQLFIVLCIDIFKRMRLSHIQLFSIKEVVLCLPFTFFPVICFSACRTLHGVLFLRRPFRSYHSYKVQQIHARLVGFGVSQFEQRWNPKSSGITCVAPLRRHIQGQNNPHITDTIIITLHSLVYYALLVYYAWIKRWMLLCQSEAKKGKKVQQRVTHSIHVVASFQHQTEDGV